MGTIVGLKRSICGIFTSMDIKKPENILSQYDFIVFALLFGSHASQKVHTMSDLDIAIYTDSEIDLLMMGEIIAALEAEMNTKVDLVVLNDLYKTDPKLAFNITDNHEVIFCRDRECYIDFKTMSMKYYFDIAPMYEMFDKAPKERLKNGTYGKVL